MLVASTQKLLLIARIAVGVLRPAASIAAKWLYKAPRQTCENYVSMLFL